MDGNLAYSIEYLCLPSFCRLSEKLHPGFAPRKWLACSGTWRLLLDKAHASDSLTLAHAIRVTSILTIWKATWAVDKMNWYKILLIFKLMSWLNSINIYMMKKIASWDSNPRPLIPNRMLLPPSYLELMGIGAENSSKSIRLLLMQTIGITCILSQSCVK